MLHDGIHEGIVSETDWELAHQKREKTGVKYEKTHSLNHEHILSGILRCPLCGSGMYGNVNRKKKKDGTLYKDYFYYACKHRRLVDGHKCGYRKQWSEEKINNAVEEVIRKLVKNPKFEEAILNKIGSRIDTEEIEKEIERLEKQYRQLTGAKARLGQQMDSLDIMDKFYEKKYQDMETRLYRLYDEIEGVENSLRSDWPRRRRFRPPPHRSARPARACCRCPATGRPRPDGGPARHTAPRHSFRPPYGSA